MNRLLHISLSIAIVAILSTTAAGHGATETDSCDGSRAWGFNAPATFAVCTRGPAVEFSAIHAGCSGSNGSSGAETIVWEIVSGSGEQCCSCSTPCNASATTPAVCACVYTSSSTETYLVRLLSESCTVNPAGPCFVSAAYEH